MKQKMYESIWVPVEFTSLWQNDRERAFFEKQRQKARRAEKRVLKAGLTYQSCSVQQIGDIRYEARFYRDVEASEKFADAVLDGLLAGRIHL